MVSALIGPSVPSLALHVFVAFLIAVSYPHQNPALKNRFWGQRASSSPPHTFMPAHSIK